MEITVGELGDDLGRYLEEVRGGTTITVTDQGRAIAQIVPTLTRLQQMIADGDAHPPLRPKRPARMPTKTKGIVSDLIQSSR